MFSRLQPLIIPFNWNQQRVDNVKRVLTASGEEERASSCRTVSNSGEVSVFHCPSCGCANIDHDHDHVDRQTDRLQHFLFLKNFPTSSTFPTMDILHTQLSHIQRQLAFVTVEPINWKLYVQGFSWIVTLFESYLLCVFSSDFNF